MKSTRTSKTICWFVQIMRNLSDVQTAVYQDYAEALSAYAAYKKVLVLYVSQTYSDTSGLSAYQKRLKRGHGLELVVCNSNSDTLGFVQLQACPYKEKASKADAINNKEK